jgi:OOP family OmpA-OmpF porin
MYLAKKSRKMGGTVCVVSLAIFAHDAMSSEANTWMVGASIGGSGYDFNTDSCKDVMGNVGLSHSCTAESRDSSYKLNVGYQFSQNFAIEGSYVNLGKLEIHGTSSNPANPAMDGNVKSSGVSLDAIGSYAFGDRWAVFGKFGLFIANTTASAALTNAGRSVTSSSATSTYGLGGQLNVARNIGLRLEWERYTNIGDKQKTLTEDVDLTSLGIVYYFK